MRARRASALLFAVGVLTSTAADRNTPRHVARVDGYYVLGADFHVHAVFGDGALAPWDAGREAQRRGIDVIAVTNHNQMFAARLHRWLFGREGWPLVIAGQEVTAPDHHILGVGISRRVDWRDSAAATIEAIHAAGGVAIAAHPHGDSARDFDAQALARLDAAERAHPGMHQKDGRASEFEAFFTRARQHNPRVSPVGDSDFHFTGEIGLCRTYLLARDPSEAGVLDALRNGRSVAYDEGGTAYGERAHLDVVNRSGLRDAAPVSRWRSRANAAGVVAAWLGLMGLVLAGPRTEPVRR